MRGIGKWNVGSRAWLHDRLSALLHKMGDGRGISSHDCRLFESSLLGIMILLATRTLEISAGIVRVWTDGYMRQISGDQREAFQLGEHADSSP